MAAGIGAVYHLGIDGPGLVMLILSGLIGIASVLASWGIRERVRSYFCLLLISEACINGAVVAHDMFVLLLFWGAVDDPARAPGPRVGRTPPRVGGVATGGLLGPRHHRAAGRHPCAVRGRRAPTASTWTCCSRCR